MSVIRKAAVLRRWLTSQPSITATGATGAIGLLAIAIMISSLSRRYQNEKDLGSRGAVFDCDQVIDM